MAINLKELRSKKARASLPPRILLYGPPGMGKTSLAAEFPNAIFIQTEDGTPGDREIAKFPLCESYGDVVECIRMLAEDEHDFTTVIVDSLDKLEPLLWEGVCEDNKWKSIEDPGFGKGYVECDRYWRYLLEGLKNLRLNRNMTIVLISHSTVERFDSPTTASFNRYDIRLHKRAMAIIQDDVDAIFFVNQDPTIKTEEGGFNKKTTRAEGGGTIWIYTVGRPAFIAKNRYGIPDKVMFRPFEGYSQLAGYLPAQAEELEPANDDIPAANDRGEYHGDASEQGVEHADDDGGYEPPGEEVEQKPGPARRRTSKAA